MITITTDAGEVRTLQAALFDMDGTIVSSIDVTERIWTQWAVDHGVTDGFEILHGRPAVDTIRRSLPDAGDDVISALVEDQATLELDDLDGVAPTTGALELLEWLDAAGVPWAVVTSAGTPLADARLGASRIRPPLLVSCDHVTRGKPDPEPYLLAARQLGVPIARCLVIEDAPAGLASGQSSGAVTAALNGHAGDVRIADLRALHDLLRQGLTD